MATKGEALEKAVKELFEIILRELGYQILKNRKQKSGTQDGFDNEIIIGRNGKKYRIYVECKDYTTKLNFAEVIRKLVQVDTSYTPDIFIFISPKVSFSNPFNDTQLESFYSKFNFPIEFLTPDTKVEEYFALAPPIYKKIYGVFPDFEIDRKEVLNRFDQFILPEKPLQKIAIDKEEKLHYITDIESTDSYIDRTVTEPNIDAKFQFSIAGNGDSFFQTTASFLKESGQNSGIVLLGNPGMGKSIELRRLALHYWSHSDTLHWIPFFREIKTFTIGDTIEDFLPKGWEEISRLLIILDGLDEIAHSQIFRSKLEKFITDHSSDKNQIRFILSCRTNIYERVIKDISYFKVYVLQDILLHKAIAYLDKKVSLTTQDRQTLLYKYPHREFLENPYYLNILAVYYMDKKELPTSKSVLLQTYIDKRLKDDRIKFKNRDFEPSSVINICKKVALAMEAMQVNEIAFTKLQPLLSQEKELFTQSSFSEMVFGKEDWKFEHRNLQEYFSAQALAMLPFESILDFICLDAAKTKMHPSWMHTVTYLLSILDSESTLYDKILSWLVANEPEVLFKADSDRIPKKTRQLVFISYFEKRALQETLWIGSYELKISELAAFTPYPETIDYLTTQAKKISNHRRARISAINLISQIHIPSKKKQIRALTFELLEAPIEIVDFEFKATIIYEIGNSYFSKNTKFIKDLIVSLGDIDFNRITHNVLRLITKVNPDDFFEYIKEVSTKIIDNGKRKYPNTDNVQLSDDSTLEDILVSFKKIKYVLFALEFYLKNTQFGSIADRKENLTKILQIIEKSILKDTTVIHKFINTLQRFLLEGHLEYHYESLIFSVFEKTNTQDIFFTRLYDLSIDFSRKIHFLTPCTTKNTIEIILNDFKEGKISLKDITHFRNSLSHQDVGLALGFESDIEGQTDTVFEDKIDIDLRVRWRYFHTTASQNSFDLLFNKEGLLDRVERYFDLDGKDTITWENHSENRSDFYRDLNMRSTYLPSFMSIIHQALQQTDGTAKKEDVIELINNDLYIVSLIKEKLSSSNNRNNKVYTVSPKQRRFIKEWCFKNIPLADFKNLTKTTNEGNRLRCELLWYFRHRFDSNYNEEVLLDLLVIDGALEFNGKNIGYTYIEEQVTKEKVDQRIIYNIKNEQLSPLILENHITYSIKHELSEVYPEIEDCFKNFNDGRLYRRSSKLFYSYTEKVIDIPFLKELVAPDPKDEYNDGLTWEAIRVLIFSGQQEYIIKKLLEFKKQLKKHESQLIVIKYLILANYKDAFLLFNEWLSTPIDLERHIRFTIQEEDLLQHKNQQSIPYLISVFKTGHQPYWDDFRLQYHPRRIAQDTVKNICQDKGFVISKEVLDILVITKEELKKESVDLFYINDFIKDIQAIYYKQLSTPMTLAEVISTIEANKYTLL